MKRLISLLLALALLLGGCVRAPEQEAPPVPDPTPAPDPLPPSEVWTDESVYTPRETAEAKYIRPEGDLSVFPTGRGPAYPYFAGENLFGFFTTGGTLLTDPVFREISDEGPVWTVQPRSEEDRRALCLVSKDGSFRTEPRYSAVYNMPEGLECQLPGTYDDYDLFDLQGNLLVSVRDQNVSVTEGAFDDLLCLTLHYPRKEDSIVSYYYGPDGQIALGPYEVALEFSDGLACVSGGDSRYGYIDRSGNWAIEPVFSRVALFRNGRAIQQIDDRTVLVDTAGNVLLEATDYHSITENGENYLRFGESFTDVCDRDGNVLLQLDGTWHSSYRLPDGILLSQDASGCSLRRLEEPDRVVQLAPVDLNESPSQGAVFVDGRLIKGFLLDDYEHGVRYWASEDLQRTGSVPLPGYVEDSWWGGGWSIFTRPYAENTLWDLMTYGVYYPVCEEHCVRIFSEDGKLLWSVPPEVWIAVIDGRLCVITDRTCTYYEPDGSVFFRFPYFVPLDD